MGMYGNSVPSVAIGLSLTTSSRQTVFTSKRAAYNTGMLLRVAKAAGMGTGMPDFGRALKASGRTQTKKGLRPRF